MIRLALLDLNNGHPNQGFGNMIEIAEAFKEGSKEFVAIETFDVRAKNEIPDVAEFDIFISSGGPDTPHPSGAAWEKPYADFLDEILEYNKTREQKKFLFLICYSFQVAMLHWDLAELTERKSYSFGVKRIRKTPDGEYERLLDNLPNPFYAVDSRAFQAVNPKMEKMKEMGAKIICKEKVRPLVPLDRALMAIRFSPEIFGTQFHPEANPAGFRRSLKLAKNRNAIIEGYGMETYRQTLNRIDDEDKVILTRKEIIPRFLHFATKEIRTLVPL